MYIVVQRLNNKEPKRIHLEPVVRNSDYYFSKIREVLIISNDLSKSVNLGLLLIKSIKTIETTFYKYILTGFNYNKVAFKWTHTKYTYFDNMIKT